ncbi:DUF6585 family protein [Acinetobacter sp. ANC 3813]|uniref:DUF6585 family protein n=1 Tax=Acinetobacter sp. ANC 3813 TaxID=1977873 RepID=UPI000A33B388|nr:DUF6585 family protein [Acinetobacter sp. ANC 3813]OTG91942.1 hypothetical protein B9T34_00915 [Acinetobacter sp. ANC 3813]
MTYTRNTLTKFYWIVLLAFLIVLLFAFSDPIGRLIIALFFIALAFLAIRSITSQITVKGRKISYKNLFTENSINITPESKIYIRRNIQSLFLVFRHYDYSIKIMNPNETLTLNSNVNSADELYDAIAQLEQQIILPVLIERFSKQNSLVMDQDLSLNTQGIRYKNKDYPYDSLSKIEFKDGYFRLLAEGKL